MKSVSWLIHLEGTIMDGHHEFEPLEEDADLAHEVMYNLAIWCFIIIGTIVFILAVQPRFTYYFLAAPTNGRFFRAHKP